MDVENRPTYQRLCSIWTVNVSRLLSRLSLKCRPAMKPFNKNWIFSLTTSLLLKPRKLRLFPLYIPPHQKPVILRRRVHYVPPFHLSLTEIALKEWHSFILAKRTSVCVPTLFPTTRQKSCGPCPT